MLEPLLGGNHLLVRRSRCPTTGIGWVHVSRSEGRNYTLLLQREYTVILQHDDALIGYPLGDGIAFRLGLLHRIGGLGVVSGVPG